jgi:hypothetical protein
MAPQKPADTLPRQRIRSISLNPADADWVDNLVDLLREAGYAKARGRNSFESRSKSFTRCPWVARARKS